ncbi:hypothetical protein M8C21_002671 [Ambrosia artemisiifolia]|uniref:Uncharacterized protein n=1 Tax=Ambrosia artemisiifolia TaxID=4212 RepID=A0AAD5G264_AMBAR|nr:hypothetical protein M8C21_002671 [Ambrosia artemisiifolia]
MIFITKTPKIMHSKASVHVFLANKSSSKDSCDFKITGSWSNRSCTIYIGESSTIIAQMHKMQAQENLKDKFWVKIYPYVDYAFVVTLMVIVEAMKSSYAENDYAENGDVANDDAENDDAEQEAGDVVEQVVEVGESIGVVADVIGTMFS